MADAKAVDTTVSNDALSLEERKFLFEKEKHAEERKENERKHILQEKELSSKGRDPLVVALIAATIAGFANVGVSYYNGMNQRQAEADRHDHAMTAERFKSEAAMISESVKSTDKMENACNLQKLIDFQLLSDDNLKNSVNSYLRLRKAERIEVSRSAPAAETQPEEYESICTISTEPTKSEAPQIAVETFTPETEATQDPSVTTVPETVNELVTSKGALIKSLDYETGWIDGGHSQAEACSQALVKYSPSFPGKIIESGDASERSRRSTFGHVTYNYFCKINVYEPVKVNRF